MVRPKNSPNDTMPSATGTARVRRAILAPRQQQHHAGSDEEHHERRHEQVAVRPDRQLDRDEVLPGEDERRRASSPSPRRSSAGAPSRDGTASGTPSTQERRPRAAPATSQPPQRRRHATAAIAGRDGDATATSSRKPTIGRSARRRPPRSPRRPRRTASPTTHARHDPRRRRSRRGARHPGRAHAVAPRRSRPDRSSSVPTVSTVSADSGCMRGCARSSQITATTAVSAGNASAACCSRVSEHREPDHHEGDREPVARLGGEAAHLRDGHRVLEPIDAAEPVEHRRGARPRGCAGWHAGGRAPRGGSRTR